MLRRAFPGKSLRTCVAHGISGGCSSVSSVSPALVSSSRVCPRRATNRAQASVAGEVCEDRTVVIAVCRADETPVTPGLQVVLAHEAADLLGVDDDDQNLRRVRGLWLSPGWGRAAPSVGCARCARAGVPAASQQRDPLRVTAGRAHARFATVGAELRPRPHRKYETPPMQRWEKQKKAARDLVRARTLARSVTRNGTENAAIGPGRAS
jgi:hypothetical protein